VQKRSESPAVSGTFCSPDTVKTSSYVDRETMSFLPVATTPSAVYLCLFKGPKYRF